MEASKSNRGFVFVMHPAYTPEHDPARLISESSAVGDYDDSFDNPGSSYLWIGDNHHLNREEVSDLAARMNHWVEAGRLKVDAE